MPNVCPLYPIAFLEDLTEYYCEICSGTFGSFFGPHGLSSGDCTNPQTPPCFIVSGEAAISGGEGLPVWVDDEIADKGLPKYQSSVKLANGAVAAGRPICFNVEHKGQLKTIKADPIEKSGMIFAYGCEVPLDKSLRTEKCDWDRPFAGWSNAGSLTVRVLVCRDGSQ